MAFLRAKGASPLARLALSAESIGSGDRKSGERAPIVYEPLQQPCEAAVIWLHGFGDGPEGWAEGLAAERLARPRWKWLFLRGRMVSQTCYAGQKVQGWGDFLETGLVSVGSADHETKDPRGCYKSTVASVHAAIDDLRRSDALKPSQIVVAVRPRSRTHRHGGRSMELPPAWTWLVLPCVAGLLARRRERRSERAAVPGSAGWTAPTVWLAVAVGAQGAGG